MFDLQFVPGSKRKLWFGKVTTFRSRIAFFYSLKIFSRVFHPSFYFPRKMRKIWSTWVCESDFFHSADRKLLEKISWPFRNDASIDLRQARKRGLLRAFFNFNLRTRSKIKMLLFLVLSYIFFRSVDLNLFVGKVDFIKHFRQTAAVRHFLRQN